MSGRPTRTWLKIPRISQNHNQSRTGEVDGDYKAGMLCNLRRLTYVDPQSRAVDGDTLSERSKSFQETYQPSPRLPGAPPRIYSNRGRETFVS